MANQYRSVLASSGPAPTGGTAIDSEVLSGKTFTNDNGLQTGSMPNRGAVSGSATPSAPYTIPEGYHNGEGIVTGSATASINDTFPTPTFSGMNLTAQEGHYYLLMTDGSYTVTGAEQLLYISIISSKCPSIIKATSTSVTTTSTIRECREIVLDVE